MQQARKWLFRTKFFSSSKWAQFLHVTLDLTGKRCPVIFSAVLFFVFKKFSSTSTGGKCALRWFYCLKKQKLSLERTPPGKKLHFCIRYLWKRKEKPANLNRGLCFSIKWKATCRNWAHLDEEKQFGLKSHLRACCTQPFNYNVYPPYPPLIGVVCIGDQIENLGEQQCKGGGGPNVNEQFLLSTRMCFSWKSHFLLTVSQQFCN